jgi:hypothetical protein
MPDSRCEPSACFVCLGVCLLQVQLLVDFLTGNLGAAPQQQLAAQVRVVLLRAVQLRQYSSGSTVQAVQFRQCSSGSTVQAVLAT